MPELPEVETTCRGIAPHVFGRRVGRVLVRQPRLRWPVSPRLARDLPGQRIESVGRRAKYLLLQAETGTLLIHLGMSGSLRLVTRDDPPGPHDHVDIVLERGPTLRLHDPRRFGSVLWTTRDPAAHPRLRDLGPDPFDIERFDGAYLLQRARGRTQPVKAFLMDARTVAGLGNIYVNEALFAAGIRPTTPAGRISGPRCARLAEAIRQVLEEAIRAGGTTLRDFVASDGRPGYFAQRLSVYGRAGQPCPNCARPVRQARHGQRSTFYCSGCQR
ncbi:MAG: bifunctional DNA-formamidopyrimidine glycosylase/DNA-(apurinic or apyrimidinic site) lyase [Gammaproteobacteria bacterium]|nr:bifunctional DNA-formamidopyrimidine glycosylase/DNA-(apurinic or apyrimidinic site) lyase [Gammaproteobacteria bacterium]NIR98107.1 bifunctional DNA-formamidopyrimidine glycosylase/DNA-(apurinic or apyrimidinic site) lyase [Gammaproteobacteria bacterium]NIT62262.1 bifunctional DNA-formamidopyrimidine glycosylase/DNA-(apurinic or apyrimidinic site) lyase [Gammaproteobacteria bacterium]NIV19113.1 bifunctional DNA-formamidopyrimidine glycosylase/DNA-(apurinic or apyrimidinic site) lyase [Gammap